MAIVSLARDYGVNPCIVRMQSDDSYATITAPGYLTSHMADFNRINGGAFQWSSSDIVLCYYLTGWSFFTLSADFSDLDLFSNGGVTPKQVQESAFNFAPGLGADDAFVVNLNPAVTAFTNGLPIYMVSAFTNLTTTPTLKINSMPALPIVTTSGEALIVDDIQNGAAYVFIYSSAGNNFQLINPSISNANAYLVQKNYFNYAIDFGAANAYQANFPFAPLVTLAGGLSAIVQIDNTNTGASTLTLNGNTAPIVGISGGALIAGEIIGGGISEFIYSDNYAAFILLNSAITPGGGTVGNGTINNLAYYAASGNTISSLATLNNGVLLTSNTGVPSLLANGTAGYVLTANSGAPPSWQAQGYLGGAVLLNPAADQTIINGYSLLVGAGGELQATSGNVVAGSSGFEGSFISFAPTAASGVLQLSANDSAGVFTGRITNLSLSADRTWSFPNVTGSVAVTSGSLVNGNIPKASGTSGLFVDSGIAASAIATTSTAVLLSPAAEQTILAHGLTIAAGGLTTAGTIQNLVGGIIAGSSGNEGTYTSYPSAAAKGALLIGATANTDDYPNILTNTATTGIRIWSLPDASGTIALTSGASGIVNSGSINQLTWYAANGTTVSGLATANNGLLVTSASGVPSIGNTIGADIHVNLLTVGQGGHTDLTGTNTAFGVNALASNASGTSNTAIGYASLTGIANGNSNTGVGTGSGQINDGISNTYVGSNSGALLGILSNGNNNSLFGASTGLGGAGVGAQDLEGGSSNTFIGFNVTGNSSVQNGAIGIGAMAVADAATGVLSTQYGPGISIGSTAVPVGFRGDGTALPGGAANYWRMKVNDTYYNIPILPDGTTIQWPATGTLATTAGGQQWINITAATTTIVPGNWYVANYTGGTTVFELPTTAAFGTEFRIKMGLAGSAFKITQAAGQQINIALGSSTAGVTGYAESTGPTDYLSLTCLTADLVFGNTGFDGNINLN